MEDNKNVRRIIFLDIDGVLAGEDYYRRLADEVKRTRDNPPAEILFIDNEKCELLNTLGDVEVVISSSWGDDCGETERRLRKRGLTLPIIGYTDHVHFKYDWACRGNEIKKWIQDNIPYGEDYRYAIIDDDSDMLLEQAWNFVKIDSYYGITHKDVDAIKNILFTAEQIK